MSEERHALIVATADYSDPKLRRLRAPAADAERLAAVLHNPEKGNFTVEVLVNETQATVIRRVARFFHNRRPTDLLLLHFSCHGVKDDRGDLYLAAADTELDLLSGTALSAAWLNDQITRTRSKRTVVLLDCCFSGSFPFGARAKASSDVNAPEQLEGTGRAVITASSAMEYAFEGEELSGKGHPSYFTEAVVEGLETGKADVDHDQRISVDDLYHYVYDRVKEKSPSQTPNKKSELEGPLYLARSTYRPPVIPADLDPALIAAAEHPYAGTREGAVRDITLLLTSPDASLALAARQRLELMCDDDSRRVSTRARGALASTPIAEAPLSATPPPSHAPSSDIAQDSGPASPRDGDPAGERPGNEARARAPEAPPEPNHRDAEDDAEVLVVDAWKCYSTGQPERAVRDFDRVLEHDHSLPNALAGRGLAKLSLRQQKDAADDFAHALKLDPACAPALVGRGLLRLHEDPRAALRDVERALEIDATSPLALSGRALVALKVKNYETAEADFDRALDADGDFEPALTGRGIVRGVLGRLPDALADLNRALQLAPARADARAMRGHILVQIQDYDVAVEDYTAALEHVNRMTLYTEFTVRLGRGRANLRLGRVDNAISDLGRALQLDARSCDALTLRGDAYMRKDDTDTALADVDAALDIDPSFKSARLVRAYIFAKRFTTERSSRLAAPHELVEQRRGENQKVLQGAEAEGKWHAVRAFADRVNGVERLLCLARAFDDSTWARKVSLLVTSDRLLWSRQSGFGKPQEASSVTWGAIDKLIPLTDGFVIKATRTQPAIDLRLSVVMGGLLDLSGVGLSGADLTDLLSAFVELAR